jgi:hypothetical protein
MRFLPSICIVGGFALSKFIVRKKDAMTNEAIVLHGYLRANEGMGLNPAISANNSPFLNFHERTDETAVSDLASIQVAGFDNSNFDSPLDIDYFALQKVRPISHLIVPSRCP